MLNLSHKKLDVWKNSIELVKVIYKLTESFPKNEIFSLTNQMRRASVSISSNVAEGASRKSRPDRKKYYQISRSSLVELDTQIEIAKQLDFLNEKDIDSLNLCLNKLFAQLTNLLNNT